MDYGISLLPIVFTVERRVEDFFHEKGTEEKKDAQKDGAQFL